MIIFPSVAVYTSKRVPYFKAMSVIVEEKTSLQQKCREANEVAQRSMEELEAFKVIFSTI